MTAKPSAAYFAELLLTWLLSLFHNPSPKQSTPSKVKKMMPSATCFALVRKSEGLRLKAYRCPAGKLTIGYGHTGPDVTEGKKITMDEAEALLHADMTHASDSVLSLTRGNVSQGQLDALTDFVFNFGASKFAGSTLLRKHNSGNYTGASLEFAKWVHAGDPPKVEPGLVKRRAAETHLYIDGTLPA